MALLHSLFCKYDALLTKYGVYKGGLLGLHAVQSCLVLLPRARHCRRWVRQLAIISPTVHAPGPVSFEIAYSPGKPM